MLDRVAPLSRLPSFAARLAAVATLCATSALAQCLSFEAFPSTPSPTPFPIHASIVWDAGAGPKIVVGQRFTSVSQPNVVSIWDGSSFVPLGSGLSGTVNAFAIYDAGGGPELYAGGSLRLGGSDIQVARWDGSAWSTIGVVAGGGPVLALCAHDDGSGPALYAGGDFSNIGGVASPDLARWNGTNWSTVGGGVGSAGQVKALVEYDEGAGPVLFVGGYFAFAGGMPIAAIARWDGATFSSVGNFPSSPLPDVRRLRTHDDGTGAKLVAAGGIPHSNVAGVATWDGAAWTYLPALFGNGTTVNALAIADTGAGAQITIVAGDSVVDPRAYRWDGASWTALPGDLRANSSGTYGHLETLDFGEGPRLSISDGYDAVVGGAYSPVLAFDGTEWVPAVAPAREIATSSIVRVVRSLDDGTGQALYVGGRFPSVDGLFTIGVARRRGTSWESFPPPPVLVFAQFDIETIEVSDVGGPGSLYVGGVLGTTGPNACQGILRFDGAQWRPLRSGLQSGSAHALATADLGNGPRLYVGGNFISADGAPSTNLASWNGSLWSAVPAGSSAGGVNGDVRALALFDAGSGPALYVGGSFTATTAGAIVNRIVRYDGSALQPLGIGMNGDVWCLRAFDDGTGAKLYAGGAFTLADGIPANRVARFDGTSWTALGAGLDQLVTSLEVFDDGSGPALYAGGNFDASGASPATRVARWTGSTWIPLANGVAPSVRALASHVETPGDAPKLFVAGALETAGTLGTTHLAAWRGCGGEIDRFCFGDGSTASCPCDNNGLASRGCQNSASTGGARLNAIGAASSDTIQLHAAGETPSATTLVFQGGVLLTSPIPFGDGMRCVGGNLKRLYTVDAVQGALTVPPVGQPSISARSAQLGDPLGAGDVRAYQTWYRDPNPAFCPAPAGATWNLSNAVRIVW